MNGNFRRKSFWPDVICVLICVTIIVFPKITELIKSSGKGYFDIEASAEVVGQEDVSNHKRIVVWNDRRCGKLVQPATEYKTLYTINLKYEVEGYVYSYTMKSYTNADSITIRYNPNNPNEIKLPSEDNGQRFFSIIVTIIGIVFVIRIIDKSIHKDL